MTTTTSSQSGGDQRGFFNLIAVLFASAAFLVAAIALVVVSTTDSGTSSKSTSTAAAAPVAVTLTEFKIEPNPLTMQTGGSLNITNKGTQVHNLAVEGTSYKTPDIAAGQSATLDLKDLKAGTYTVVCLIPGHKDSGMKATLTVSDTAPATSTASSGGGSSNHDAVASGTATPEQAAAIDKQMAEGMKAGLATFTGKGADKGKQGNQKLAPTTVEADGTKVFDLEASIIDWEVSPGKIVKAWAYNGMVPGPWIRTEPNDKVKVNIKNNLPISTDIHWHGISTPFDQDGIAYLTQDPILPGTTYTYSWTNTNHPELGMYHTHFMGNVAVLNGLFAVFQVGDIALPGGETVNYTTVPANIKTAANVTQELPIVLNDAGVIGLSLNGKSYPATEPIAANPGESLLVHYYNEGLLSHPMHLHHVPQLVVAKDGFPLEQPYWADTINVAPGERYSVLVLPTTQDIGVWAWHCHILNHAEDDNGLFGMVTALVVADPNKK